MIRFFIRILYVFKTSRVSGLQADAQTNTRELKDVLVV